MSSPSQVSRDSTGRKLVVDSCYICYNEHVRKRRKTRKLCGECSKPICAEHAKTTTRCIKC